MATGTEILSYEGSGGLGSNADIPAIATKGLEILGQTAERLQAYNMAQNHAIFQQKVRDRDKLLAAIDSGDIQVGDLLEQDMPLVKEGLQKLDDAYFDRIKKGMNDIDAAREYNKAKREAQDRVTQAQARKLYHDSLNGEIAKEELPRKQEAMKSTLDKNINGGFFKDLTPYQQTQDLDIAKSILSTAANVSEQYTDPKNPLMKGKRTVFDYDKTLLNNKDNFLNDANKRHDQGQLVAAIQSLPPDEFIENMQVMNERIREYNKLKGLQPGTPGFVDEIQFGVDPQSGQAMIKESLPDFSAKYTLAHQKPFGSVETEFDKDLGAYKLGEERNRIARINAGANATRAAAYAALQRKKLSQLTDDEKRVKNFWDGITGKVKLKTMKDGRQSDFVFTGDLPEGYKLIGGLDAKGQPIELKPKRGPKGTEYYDTKYYDVSGNEMDLLSQYTQYKKAGGTGSYNDLRNNLLKAGKIDMELVGQNGVGNFETAGQAARAISNKGTTKGEEPIFFDEEEQE